MPLVAVAFIIGGLVSMGMPGFSVLSPSSRSLWACGRQLPWMAIIAAISIVITAAYIIRIIGKVFFGSDA